MRILVFQFFLIVFWGIVVHFISNKKRIQNKLFLSVAFLSMWYVHSMVVPSTFSDLPVYLEVFKSIGITEWKKIPNHWAHINMELGYLYYNKLIYYISSSFTVFLWIFSFVMLYCYVWTIKKYSPYIVLSIILFLLISYNQSLFVIRQHMAVAIYFATIPLILERRLVLFLLVAIAVFFLHRSSLIFIPVYFIYAFNGKKIIFALGAAIVFIFMFWGALIALGASLFDYEWFTQEAEEMTNVTTFIQFALFFLLYLLSLRKSIFENGINKLVFCVLSLALFFNTISVGFNIGRLGLYFNVIAILSIPLSLKYIRNKFIKYIIGVGIIVLLFVQMVYGSNQKYVEDMQLYSLF